MAKFFFAFLLTETRPRSIKMQKRKRPISSHLDPTSLVNKQLILWPNKNSCATSMGNPEWARWAHLSHLGSQSECRIGFISPAHRFSQTSNEITAHSHCLTFNKGSIQQNFDKCYMYMYYNLHEKV